MTSEVASRAGEKRVCLLNVESMTIWTPGTVSALSAMEEETMIRREGEGEGEKISSCWDGDSWP